MSLKFRSSAMKSRSNSNSIRALVSYCFLNLAIAPESCLTLTVPGSKGYLRPTQKENSAATSIGVHSCSGRRPLVLGSDLRILGCVASFGSTSPKPARSFPSSSHFLIGTRISLMKPLVSISFNLLLICLLGTNGLMVDWLSDL